MVEEEDPALVLEPVAQFLPSARLKVEEQLGPMRPENNKADVTWHLYIPQYQ
jgi:hypothetical protein